MLNIESVTKTKKEKEEKPQQSPSKICKSRVPNSRLSDENLMKEQQEVIQKRFELKTDIKQFEKRQNRQRKDVPKINVKMVDKIPGQAGFDVASTKKNQGASPLSNFYCSGYKNV